MYNFYFIRSISFFERRKNNDSSHLLISFRLFRNEKKKKKDAADKLLKDTFRFNVLKKKYIYQWKSFFFIYYFLNHEKPNV